MSDNLHTFEKSTSIKHTDYDDAKGIMEICFHSGNTYKYKCDRSVYEALKAAKSPGGHFHNAIRNKIPHIK